MCGIFGVVIGEDSFVKPEKLRETVDRLFLLSESRGKEASGLAVLFGDEIKVYKQPIPGSRLIQREMYNKLFNGVFANGDSDGSLKGPLAVIGHSRLATNGIQTDNDDNQPVISQGAVGIHNGIIVNNEELAQLPDSALSRRAHDRNCAAQSPWPALSGHWRGCARTGPGGHRQRGL